MLAKRLIVVVVAVALLAGACGAPEFEYVKNSEQHTYFKVPNGWRQVDQDELDAFAAEDDPDSAAAQIRKSLMWTVAYDAAAEPDISHLGGYETTLQPIVWAKVEQLMPSVSSAISMDVMRDLLLPVTEERRKLFEENNALLPDFELLHDEVLNPEKGLHGVRVVYNYRLTNPLGIGGQLHTFDLTALVNDDASVLYMLLMRCSAKCYADRFDELQKIVTSFTVRS